MKSLVVFYSLDGHTRRVAESIAKASGADIRELRPRKANSKTGFLKYFLGGMHASFGHKEALRDPLPDLTPYDRVLIGTPVWAGKPAPAVNTFLAGCNLEKKQVLLFACSGGADNAKCFDTMKARLHGGTVLGQLGFAQAISENPTAVDAKVKEWLAKF
jgi:flavodoxin